MTTQTEHSAYELARLAEVASPDSPTSPGAEWLNSVARWAEDVENDDDITEAADSVVPVYTHERWRVFVDLAAYNEDPTDLGADASDMTQAAGVALFLIAERLIQALLQEREEEDDGNS
jgi:hypothetical protein